MNVRVVEQKNRDGVEIGAQNFLLRILQQLTSETSQILFQRG